MYLYISASYDGKSTKEAVLAREDKNNTMSERYTPTGFLFVSLFFNSFLFDSCFV